MPRTMSAIPRSMPGLIGIPASRNPVMRPIQNIGRCRITPVPTMADPPQKASLLLQEVNNDAFGFMTRFPRDSVAFLSRELARVIGNVCAAITTAETVKGPGAQSKNSKQRTQQQGGNYSAWS